MQYNFNQQSSGENHISTILFPHSKRSNSFHYILCILSSYHIINSQSIFRHILNIYHSLKMYLVGISINRQQVLRKTSCLMNMQNNYFINDTPNIHLSDKVNKIRSIIGNQFNKYTFHQQLFKPIFYQYHMSGIILLLCIICNFFYHHRIHIVTDHSQMCTLDRYINPHFDLKL